MIAVHAVPKTLLNLHFRGGYQPGSRGRKLKKGENWNVKCINCNQTFPNRVVLRTHYHTECKDFDVAIENKENTMATEAEEIIVVDNNTNEIVLKTEINIHDDTVSTMPKKIFKRGPNGDGKDDVTCVIEIDEKQLESDVDKLETHREHVEHPTTGYIKETVPNGQKRSLGQTAGDDDQSSKIRKLEDRPKNLYQTLSEQVLQEKWHSLFDRVPNKDRPYQCPKCKVSFKYRNKLEMHVKHTDCRTTEYNHTSITVSEDVVMDTNNTPGDVEQGPNELKDFVKIQNVTPYGSDIKLEHGHKVVEDKPVTPDVVEIKLERETGGSDVVENNNKTPYIGDIKIEPSTDDFKDVVKIKNITPCGVEIKLEHSPHGLKEVVKDMNITPHVDRPVNAHYVVKRNISPEITNADYSKDKRAKHACTLCPMRFRWISRLDRHMKSVHNYSPGGYGFEPMHKCNECDMSWTNRSSMLRHQRTFHDAPQSDDNLHDVKQEKLTDKPQPVPAPIVHPVWNTPARLAQNFNPVDVMQYLRANLMCLNQMQMRTPVVQPKVDNTSRDQFKYENSNNSRKKEVTSNRMEKTRNVGEVKLSPPPKICDVNDMPLDLSVKSGRSEFTGSDVSTGSMKIPIKTEIDAPVQKVRTPYKFIPRANPAVHSYYKTFLKPYGHLNE